MTTKFYPASKLEGITPHDPRVIELIRKHGIAGYGHLVCLVILISQSKKRRLSIEYVDEYNALAFELGVNREYLKKFLHACIFKFHLLETDGSSITLKS